MMKGGGKARAGDPAGPSLRQKGQAGQHPFVRDLNF